MSCKSAVCCSLLVTLLVVTFNPRLSSGSVELPRDDGYFLSNNFEGGSIIPWVEVSLTDINWRVEDYNSPAEPNYQPPFPLDGTKYLRITRNSSNLLDGRTILRSPEFTAYPGDEVVFAYWIRSFRTEGNDLEVLYCSYLYKFTLFLRKNYNELS